MLVSVFGAGTMGSGIAQVFAAKGHEVLMYASSVASAQRHKANLAKSLQKRVDKGKMAQEDCDALLGRIRTEEIEASKDADLIIECVAEKMEPKKALLKQLDELCKPETIFATNTSSLSITEVAAGLSRPVVGMHFFNPVPAMKLVEVIAGMNTPDDLVEWTCDLSKEIGKTPVVVKEAPGFVVNRILIPMINEGVTVLAEGTAEAADIDTAMKLGANLPMGPLELGDLVGWDVVLSIMDVFLSETGDSKYRAHPLIRKMVRAGKLGRKSGEGIYKY